MTAICNNHFCPLFCFFLVFLYYFLFIAYSISSTTDFDIKDPMLAHLQTAINAMTLKDFDDSRMDPATTITTGQCVTATVHERKSYIFSKTNDVMTFFFDSSRFAHFENLPNQDGGIKQYTNGVRIDPTNRRPNELVWRRICLQGLQRYPSLQRSHFANRGWSGRFIHDGSLLFVRSCCNCFYTQPNLKLFIL